MALAMEPGQSFVLSAPIAQEEIDAGRVEHVLPPLMFEMGTLSAVWPRSRNLSPRIRTFVDFLVEVLVPLLSPSAR